MSEPKVVLYRAPLGYGKSVQVACEAGTRDLGAGGTVYINTRSYPGSCDITDTLFAALVLYQIKGRESWNSIESDIDIIESLRDTLFSSKMTIKICLDGIGETKHSADLIEDLICETPNNVKFYIAPSSAGALARLSMMANVVTYGADELAFTEEEVCELSGVHSPNAKNIIKVTGGWPALVGLMCHTSNPNLPAAAWPETRSYFRNNLLTALPNNTRTFICKAAMLEEISAECYDYVYKTEEADREISFLNENYALLSPTGSSDECMVMHPVLREYLRSLFNATQRERRSYVLKRVAFWHWRRGEYLHSINAALEASDHRWARVVNDSIILDVALRQGEIEVLRTWFEKVPVRTIKKIASLSIGYAWILYFSQQARQAEEILASSVDPSSRGLGNLDEEGWRELVNAIGKATQDELLESQTLCQKWIDSFGERNMVGKGAALTCQAFIASSDRRFEDLERLLHKAAVANQSSNQHYAFIWLKTSELQAELFKGDIARAMSVLLQANKTAAKMEVPKTFLSKMFGSLELQILHEKNHHLVTHESAQASFNFALNYGVTDILWGCTHTYSSFLFHQGFRDRAIALLEQTRLAACERDLPRLNILTKIQLAEFTLLNNEELGPPILPDDCELTFLPNQNQAIRARIALLNSMYRLRLGKQFGVAEKYAKQALQSASAISDARTKVAAQYCQALAAFALGSSKLAKRTILDANLLSEHLSCHFTRLWIRKALLSLSPIAHDLFDEIPDNSEAIATKDLEIKTEDSSAPLIPGDANSTITIKQISLLKCVSNGMTNKEIAERLLVTEDTVKWHMKKIFSELKVTNRIQAVTEARLRGLL
ncbi:LuxR C-terminal-related transcriptional regulator [Marinobacter alexandrii]|jgi:ATP/maltotriose-dependent transcriptional regulator MalT|uniref:LuxR C-terminal-related transcriptional regulator n=1 Tax=Marinobacter alexandrii TaxID=2570351 RepID=UPI002ABD6E4D|nr:LuxR C-terminal-related transcriptional regulator [Marinobacter alexandrii]